MNNEKIYEDKAKQMTEDYFKNNPNLKFIAVYDKDKEGNQVVSFKIVKTEEDNLTLDME